MKQDTKKWDKILVRIYMFIGSFATYVVGAIDIGRFKWSCFAIAYVITGYIIFIISIIMNYTLYVNRHFGVAVRIQKERDHKVIHNGPNKMVKHPEYLAGILYDITIL